MLLETDSKSNFEILEDQARGSKNVRAMLGLSKGALYRSFFVEETIKSNIVSSEAFI